MISFNSSIDMFYMIKLIQNQYYLSLDTQFKLLNTTINEYDNLQHAMFIIIKQQALTNRLPSLDSSVLEQAIFFNENPKEITSNYLENFLFHTPGGQFREMSKLVGTLEKTLADVYLERNGKLPENLEILHSNKRLNSTYNYFYRDIDNSIIDKKLAIEDISKLNSRFFEDEYKTKRQEIIDELNLKLIPVYLDLRKKGYSHYDLVI